MALKPVNQSELMYEKLLSQYKGAQNFSTFFREMGDELCQDIEDQGNQIYNMCDLDNSSGNLLDAAGSLIGLARMKVLIPTDVWQLDQTPWSSHRFGDKVYLLYATASDEIYRDAIKAWAISQTSQGDLRSLKTTLMLLWGMTVDTDLTITQTASLAVTIDVNVNVTVSRNYLVTDFLAPNGSSLWSKAAGCVYTFNYPP